MFFLTAWLSWDIYISELLPQGGNSHPCPPFLCADPANCVLSGLRPKTSWEQILYLFFLLLFCPFSSVGARPKLTKRNSMESVELWKFSTVKVSAYRLLSAEWCWTLWRRMLSHCRMVRTKTLRAYPRETRASFHSRAKGKAVRTVSRRTRGRGWTRLWTPTTSLCKCPLQLPWVPEGMQSI